MIVTRKNREIQFVVGNTYKNIPETYAVQAKSAPILKVHDWQLYVDVVNGNPDDIRSVVFDLGSTFSPQRFTSRSPIPIKYVDGRTHWRFQTRQQSYGLTKAIITILGSGGSREDVHYKIVCQENGSRLQPKDFVERGSTQTIPILNMPRGKRFGIELELTSTIDLITISRVLKQQLGSFSSVTEIKNKDRTNIENVKGWKIVPDSSIVSNGSQINHNRFKIISPDLTEDTGLGDISRVVENLHSSLDAKTNATMDFCVHVDVSDLSLRQLIKVCQNFIKYETVLDSFMPKSAKESSQEGERLCKSNQRAIDCHSNRERHRALTKCESIAALARMMNPTGRYYKLDLQNLITGRQPTTVEFHQHPATTDHQSVTHWIRLCVALVRNSAILAEPTPFKESRSLEYRFDALFFYNIKDRALRDIYRERKNR